jgi:hypothetical protein
MRSCQFEECGADLTGYPPASKYCSTAHTAAAKRDQEAAYARRNRGPINRRRRNREAKKAREERGFKVPDVPKDKRADRGGRDDRHDEVVVDYSTGDALPGMRPVSQYRSSPRHDAVTRARLDRQAQDQDADAELASWDNLVAMRDRFGMRAVDFPAPPMESYAPHPLGRSVPRSRGLYGRNDSDRELVNPAAESVAIVVSPAAGRAMVQQHTESRFGPGIEMPAPIHSSQLHSSMPAMEKAERVQAVQVRQASEHARSLGWTRR